MALVPIYKRAPLMEMEACRLMGGRARVEDGRIEAIAKFVNKETMPQEALRLSFLLNDAVMDREEAAVVVRWMAKQHDDGSFDDDVVRCIALLRAAFVLYEATGNRSLAEGVIHWCAWANSHWDEIEQILAADPVDAMELFVSLFRRTGVTGILKLCEKLRPACSKWAAKLNVFSLRGPALKVADGAQYKADTELMQSVHGAALARGARAAMAGGVFSGNGQEMNAVTAGWQRISRAHGAVCGGLHCDELVGGQQPDAPVSSVAAAEWAETLCIKAAANNSSQLFDQVERMAYNVLPAAIKQGRIVNYQRVNSISGQKTPVPSFDTKDSDDAIIRSLARAWASIGESAVTMSLDGIHINMMIPGCYTVRAADQQVKVIITEKNEIRLQMKDAAVFAVKLRVPGWAESADVCLNGKKAELKAGGYSVIRKEWHNDDTLILEIKRALLAEKGFHQAISVYDGPVLMRIPATDRAIAICGEPYRSAEKVCVKTAFFADESALTANLPVLPETAGEPKEVEMLPYTESDTGLSVLPRSRNA